MTSDKRGVSKKKMPVSGLFLLSGTLGVSLILLVNTDIAIGCMRHGLDVCARTVIPSLFPFMVLSGLLVELGAAEVMSPVFSAPMRFFFGISGAGCASPVMGALCGFPVGALTAIRLYEKKTIGKEELERLFVISGNPSSAFLISAVGTSLWSCPRFGVILYVTHLISAFAIGAFLQLVCPLRPHVEKSKKKESRLPRISFRASLTRTVTDAAGSMLTVCAFVLFFAAVCGAMTGILEKFGVSQTVKSLIYGFFEMSGAVCEAAKITPQRTGLVVTALICGWSGLSVHFQVMSLCKDSSVSFMPYICGKALQGVLSALAVLAYVSFAGEEILRGSVPAAEVTEKTGIEPYALIMCVLFLLSVVFCFAKKRKSKAQG